MPTFDVLVARQNGPPPPPPTEIAINLTMAPTYFGNIFAWFLFALVLVQAYIYQTHFKRDHALLKAFVIFAVVIAAGESALETFVGYFYLVSGWGNDATVGAPPKALLFQPVFDALCAFLAQNFYAWRIKTLGRSALTTGVAGLISVLSLMQIICAIAIPVVFLNIDVQDLLLKETNTYTTIWLVSSAVTDIIITICMFGILQNAKSKEYFAASRDLLTKLTRITIQTGTLTSVLALAVLIVFKEEKVGNMHTFPAYLLGKSYIMSILANLNARTTKSSGEPGEHTSLAFLTRGGRRNGILSFLSSRGGVTEDAARTTMPERPENDANYPAKDDRSKGTGSSEDIHLQALPNDATV
ncbi:hypothetical protein K439DRAFT_720440 [Ramaria rubella]|nr:hypothetical protein K439DRAFT_720440 [Ramaria rubella]